MGRSAIFVKGLKKGPWTSEEDQKLVDYIEQHGLGSWRALPSKAGLQRCGKSCRLRWTNYLRPDIKRGKFSLQEEQTIIQLHALLGNRWSTIATHLPKRTDNEIKNYWNTHLKKRLMKMGIDPITHKSRTAANTTLSHMTQWENARLEAEARLVRGTRLVSNFNPQKHCGSDPHSTPSFPPPQSTSHDALKSWQGITLSKLSDLNRLNEQAISNVDLLENFEPSSHKEDIIINNQWKVSKTLFEDEGAQNIPEVTGLIYQDECVTEELVNHVVKDASNGNYHGDFEDVNYWSSILDILGNNSSFSTVF